METAAKVKFVDVNTLFEPEPEPEKALPVLKLHSKISFWRCDKCSKMFKSAYYLNIHKRNHTAKDAQQSSMRKKSNDAHCLDSTPEPAEAKEVAEGEAVNEVFLKTGRFATSLLLPIVMCDICGADFGNQDALNKHYKRVHATVTNFSCDQCDGTFKTHTELTSHVDNQHRVPVMCDVCGKMYCNIYRPHYHQRKSHYPLKYQCPHCMKSYKTEEYYEAHLKRHENSQPFICDICGKNFKRKKDISKHMMVHSDKMPYVCKICSRSFKTANTVSQHLLLHTGQMLYTCDICGKVFAQKAGLIGHRKKHTGPLPPLPEIPIRHIVKDLYKQDEHNTVKIKKKKIKDVRSKRKKKNKTTNSRQRTK